MEFSSEQLVFDYKEGHHLPCTLTLTSRATYNQMFKIKASTANKFIVKPNVGSIGPGQSLAVEIVIHKDAVPNYANERLQIIYGKSLEEPQSTQTFIFQIRVNNMESDLNLTRMIETKHHRIKELEKEVTNFKTMPVSSAPVKNKSSKFTLKLIIAVVLGLLLGFFGPIKIFRKKLVR